MNTEKKAATKSGTASVARTFGWMLASAIISSKVCLFILKFGPSGRQQAADKGHSEKCCKFTITFAPWLGPQILFTYPCLSLGFP